MYFACTWNWSGSPTASRQMLVTVPEYLGQEDLCWLCRYLHVTSRTCHSVDTTACMTHIYFRY